VANGAQIKKRRLREPPFRILTETLECDIQTLNNLGRVLGIIAQHIVIEVAWIKPACLYKIGEVLCDLP
jgi:hypothetical protein